MVPIDASRIIHETVKSNSSKFCELIEFNDYQKAKDAGKIRLEGKEYEVQDGDIMNFRFNN